MFFTPKLKHIYFIIIRSSCRVVDACRGILIEFEVIVFLRFTTQLMNGMYLREQLIRTNTNPSQDQRILRAVVK